MTNTADEIPESLEQTDTRYIPEHSQTETAATESVYASTHAHVEGIMGAI